MEAFAAIRKQGVTKYLRTFRFLQSCRGPATTATRLFPEPAAANQVQKNTLPQGAELADTGFL